MVFDHFRLREFLLYKVLVFFVQCFQKGLIHGDRAFFVGCVCFLTYMLVQVIDDVDGGFDFFGIVLYTVQIEAHLSLVQMDFIVGSVGDAVVLREQNTATSKP